MSDKTREEFEAFIKSAKSFKDCFLTRSKNGDYEYSTIQAAREGWQSAKERYEPKWVNIKERMPNRLDGASATPVCLVVTEAGQTVTAFYVGNGPTNIWMQSHTWVAVTVTHWMPLPEADL